MHLMQSENKMKTKILTAAKLQSLSTLGTVVGAFYFLESENVEWNMNRYSKGWHRAHGGCKEVTDRKVTVYQYCPRRKVKLHMVASVPFASWAGNTVLRALKGCGLFAPVKSALPLSVRLDAYYDAKLIETKHGYKIYSRTLLGEHQDYVIVSPLGMVYHDADKSKLIVGVIAKTRAKSRKLEGLIDWKKCRSLGFCVEGLTLFCSVFGLSTKERYTPAEIEGAVRKAPEKAVPFLSELKTLSSAIGYNVAEFN